MTIILAATALMAAAACTNDNDTVTNPDAPVPARITAGMAAAVATPAAKAGQPGTRAVDDSWNGDHIGVIVLNSPGSDMAAQYRNAHYKTTSTGTTAEFTPADLAQTIYFSGPDETVEFAAYAPYQASATPDALPGTDGLLSFDTRVQTTAAQQEAIDILVATGAMASKSSPTVRFTKVDNAHDYSFHHIMTRLVLKIETPAANGFAPADVERISQVMTGGLYTTGTLNVKPDPATGSAFGWSYDVASRTDGWDITQNVNRVEAKNGVTQRIYTLIFPQQQVTDNAGNDLSALPLSITLDNQVYKNDKDITGNVGTKGFFESGKSYEYTISLKKTGLEVTGATITNWADGGTGSGDATKQ